eukprot:gene35062-65083_t
MQHPPHLEWKAQWAAWCDRNGGLRGEDGIELQQAIGEIGQPPQGPG